MNRTDQLKLTSSFSIDVWNITTSPTELKICWNNYRILEATTTLRVSLKSVEYSSFQGGFLPEYQVVGQQRLTDEWIIQAVEYGISTPNGTLIGKMGLVFLHLGVPVAALNNDGRMVVPRESKILTKVNPPSQPPLQVPLGNGFLLSTTGPLEGDTIPLGLFYQNTALVVVSTNIVSTISPPTPLGVNTCSNPASTQNTSHLQWLAVTAVIVGVVAVVALIALISRRI